MALPTLQGCQAMNLAEEVWRTMQREYQFIMDINVMGLFHVLSVSLRPGFLDENSSVVHIGSMFSLQGFKNGAVFAASKHAALGMVRSAAKETNGNIRVNCVLPYVLLFLPPPPPPPSPGLTIYSGVVDTPMHQANLARVQECNHTCSPRKWKLNSNWRIFTRTNQIVPSLDSNYTIIEEQGQ